MSTPYGRTGWADYFLRQGYIVYLVDGPARGRSAWHNSVDGPIGMRVYVPEGGSQANNPREKKHTQRYAGEVETRKGDPAFDNFYAGLVPQLDSLPEIETLTQSAGSALLDKIGPALLVTHSQSGLFGWLLADSRPKLVKGVLAIEPNGPPFEQGQSYPGNERAWGLTDIPLTYAPPVSRASELAPVREGAADAPDLTRCWKQADPPRQLPNIQGVPVLIVTSETSPHAAYDHCTSKYLTQAGVKNTYLKLVDHGIHGNSHHMMLEQNNLEIAGLIHKWVQSNVK
jgi:pimeloyl-ACP methyl ester carboxylesterase